VNKHLNELVMQVGGTHKQSLGVYQFFQYELEEFVAQIIQESFNAVISDSRFDAVKDTVELAESIALKHFEVK
jgi:hypothetical protein